MLLKVRGSVDSTAVADVQTGPVVGISVLSSLVTTIIALLTFWLVTKPGADQQRELTALRFRAEMLATAMQLDSAADRAAALRLLLATGLLNVPDREFVNRIPREPGNEVTLPRWPASSH